MTATGAVGGGDDLCVRKDFSLHVKRKTKFQRTDVYPFVLFLYPLIAYCWYTEYTHYHIPAKVLAKQLAATCPSTAIPWIDNAPLSDLRGYTVYDVRHLFSVPVPIPQTIQDLLWQSAQDPPTWSSLALGFSVFCHVFLFLSTYWWISMRIFVAFNKANSVENATHVKVSRRKGFKSTELCQLHRERTAKADGDLQGLSLIYHQKRLLYDVERGTFVSPSYPTNLDTNEYLGATGIGAKSAEAALMRYGPNHHDMQIPDFMTLFKEHALSPMFIFQVFCLLLWMLDEYWQYSLFTLVLLVVMESQIVKNRLSELKFLQSQRPKPQQVLVYRDNKWSRVSSHSLVPGDIVGLSRVPLQSAVNISSMVGVHKRLWAASTITEDSDEVTVPCDVVLLRGSLLIDESVLSGESVPQMKVPLTADTGTGTGALVTGTDMASKKITIRKSSFAPSGGVVVSHDSSDADEVPHIPAVKDDSGSPCAVAYVLRTGFATTQGKLMRTMYYFSKRITASTKESYAFLGILLCAALIAAGFVVYHGYNDPERSRFKVLLNCIFIITSVVSPEFPLVMSISVSMTLVMLQRHNIFCIEPFRVAVAGNANLCAFDKTGTLTTSEPALNGVYVLDDLYTGTGTTGTDTHAGYDLPPTVVSYLDGGDVDGGDGDKDTGTPPTTAAAAASGAGTAAGGAGAGGTAAGGAGTAAGTAAGGAGGGGGAGGRVQQLDALPFTAAAVLGCCQSVTMLKGNLVGDPLDICALTSAEWKLGSNGRLSRGSTKAQVLRRFPFSSDLQRMTTLAEVDKGANDVSAGVRSGCIVTVKGSPEKIKTFLRVVPRDYDATQQALTAKGLRVLSLAFKWLPSSKASSAARSMSRAGMEEDLTFAGFFVLASQIKTGTVRTLRKLRKSNHRLVMMTGDNSLTAIEVATTVGFYKESNGVAEPLVLAADLPDRFGTSTDTTGTDMTKGVAALSWRNRNSTRVLPFDAAPAALANLAASYRLCATGSAITHLEQSALSNLTAHCDVFARLSPQQKETLIQAYTKLGYVSVMCGDGTNDVGALKAAHAGVSILGLSIKHSADDTGKPGTGKSGKKKSGQAFGTDADGAPVNMDGLQMIKFGDASFASPFTFKGSSIKCVSTLVRYCRATLVTTLMMYKHMAVNSLITAFALSVLTINGVKFGDFQVTSENILVTFLSMFASRATPLLKISDKRPAASVFTKSVLLSIGLQSLVHLSVLVAAWQLAQAHTPSWVVVKVDSDFQPNLVNTSIFILYSTMHFSTFIANHPGEPFVTKITEQKMLLRGILFMICALTLFVSEQWRELNDFFSLVPFPSVKYRAAIALLVCLDLGLSCGVGMLTKWMWLRWQF